MSQTNRQIRLAARPVGNPKRSDWNFTEEPVGEPGPGGVLVKFAKPGQERRADLPTIGPETVRRGRARIGRAELAPILAPADMPRLSKELIDFVIAAHRPEAPRIVVPTSGGRRGHPVLLARDTWDEVSASATGEQGARVWLAAHPEYSIFTSGLKKFGLWDELATEGKLREDLFYRISAITISLPPLRLSASTPSRIGIVPAPAVQSSATSTPLPPVICATSATKSCAL